MPLTSGETFAGFRIVRLLGSGGMGEVYLAEHPRLPRRDALKILPEDVSVEPDYRARFNREADLASNLWHPHVVSVHDRGEYDGQLWISMDYVRRASAASHSKPAFAQQETTKASAAALRVTSHAEPPTANGTYPDKRETARR
jgi:serine/threonine protein kinase